MYEKEKKDENLIKKTDDINSVKSLKPGSKYAMEDYNISHKNSKKSFEELSEEAASSNRISVKNRNSEGGNLLFINSDTNSIESFSHKNLGKIKFHPKIFEEDDGNRSQSGAMNNSKIINDYFKTHNISYICNLLSYSIGFESIWRFPYYFINAEGAVFFIPFIIFYFFLGIPILTLESALGQIFKRSPLGIFSLIKERIDVNYNYSIMTIKMITLFIAYVITIYFSSITAQGIHYFLLCFEYNLPWSYQLNTDKLYHSPFYKINFINHDSTHQNFDIFRLGEINYHKLISSFLTWLIFYLLLVSKFDLKKHKYIYRMLCFFPVFMLVMIFITLVHPSKGFKKGCIYFLIPNLEKLLHLKSWIFGINQAIFLLMLGYGKNYLFSSTIKEKDNVYSRSTLTSLIVLCLGIFWTFFDCIYAGLIAEELNIDSINNIPFNNSNIPFISNLLAIGLIKHNRVVSILFLLSIIIIGFQSQYLMVKNFSIFIQKSFSNYLTPIITPIFLCTISFIFCIPFTRFQGQFFLEWIDKYISIIPLVFIVFYEIIFIMRKLGINLLMEIISNKTNIILPLYVFYFTKYITPIVLIVMMAFALIYQYQNTQYSTLTKVIEWFFLLSPFIFFILFFIRDFLSKKSNNFADRKDDNILKNDIFDIKRKNSRKKTQHNIKAFKLPFERSNTKMNSSFTYGYRGNKYMFSDSLNNLKSEIDNNSVRPNFFLDNNDTSMSITENNTRKPTIEMEVLNKK